MTQEEIAKQLLEYMNNGKKIKVRVPGINQYSNEGPFSENMNPIKIKVGDKFWLDKSNIGSLGPAKWFPIEVTYVRSGVIFYKVIAPFAEVKEEFMLEDCLAIKIGQLQPMEYVAQFDHEYEQYMFEFVPLCPYTKVSFKIKAK